MKNIFKSLLTLSVATLALIGCSTGGNDTENQTQTSTSESGADENIALVIHRQDDDWSQSFASGFEEAVLDNGYNYTFENPNNDLETQISQIELLTTQGVDGIGIIALDTDAVSPALNTAMSDGIAVVSGDPIPGVNHIVTSGNYDAGAMVAEELVEELGGEGEIAVIDITASMPGVALRTEGFMDYITENSNIQVVEEQRITTTDEGINAAENILTSNPNLDGIFATFANATIGAGRAAKNMQNEDVVIVGIDGDKEILRLIDESWVFATSSQDPVTHAAAFVDEIIALMKDEAEEENFVEVPYILATQDNFEEVWEQLYGSSYADEN